jgi:hypothetical protein
MAAGAAVAQGVRSVLVVAMHPVEDGLVVAAEVSGAGGGVVGARGDEVERLEAFAGAGVGGVQRGPPEVFQGLLPLADLDTHHGTAPFSLLAGNSTLPNLPKWWGTETPGLNLILV